MDTTVARTQKGPSMEDWRMNILWVAYLTMGLFLGRGVGGFEALTATEVPAEVRGRDVGGVLFVGLQLIQTAAAKGAVCLDGTLPGYHLHYGYGSGANNWLIQLEGGGWCYDIRTCVFRKTTRHGSSNYMEEWIPFGGILSNSPEENPDFYNWNRVKVRYCDGASFSGEGYDKFHSLFFRGQRIWLAVMEEMMLKGMRDAKQALLSGCSAGGLSAIIHCDEFRELFQASTKVKCLSDAGLFLDVADIAGKHVLKSIFDGVVTLQGVAKNLPQSCSSTVDPTSCFFPQNLINHIQTPIFLLNSAYDTWQLKESVVPPTADPNGVWNSCMRNYTTCSPEQIAVLQGFRNQMSENQTTWFANDSPVLMKKRIAQAVGDWFLDRSAFKAIDCPYPCEKTVLEQSWANNCCPLLFVSFFIIICSVVFDQD